ncbi:MAG: formate dehydrogenase subunit delta [Alphaproteobacteria bacterium]|nr:formate dehydrogenase subunit delta [Alphaproteobacteria bacterium]
MNTDEKLVVTANQVAAFFAVQGEARAVPAIADHFRKFWDPQMRRRFLGADHARLHPLAKQAALLLADPPAR